MDPQSCGPREPTHGVTEGPVAAMKDADVAARRHNHRWCRHEWQLVSDDVDEFGHVRMFECRKCGYIHFT